MLLNCGVGEDSWESFGLQGDPTSPFWRRSALGFLWKQWCWSWNSSTLATSCEELTHWKRLWCWDGLGAGGEGDDRGWDGWMASLTLWTWVWVNSGSWWWTREAWRAAIHGVAKIRTRQSDWTELNWRRSVCIVWNVFLLLYFWYLFSLGVGFQVDSYFLWAHWKPASTVLWLPLSLLRNQPSSFLFSNVICLFILVHFFPHSFTTTH